MRAFQESPPRTRPPPESILEADPVVEDEEEDPLDAYMRQLETDMENAPAREARPDMDELKAEDPMDVVIAAYKNRPIETQDEEFEYDSDGQVIHKAKENKFVPLIPAIDFRGRIEPFQKRLRSYAIGGDEIRRFLGIRSLGAGSPVPCLTWPEFLFEERVLANITREKFTKPTAIQSQAVPLALMGRDVVAVSATGSGKTGAYLWPMINHILEVHGEGSNDGPFGVVIAPTRELAHQVLGQAKRYTRGTKLRVAGFYGGSSVHEQKRSVRNGIEIIVATPGRLIDHIKEGTVSLQETTMLVLDEADRMLQLGFEPQIRTVSGQIRPDRQVLMFSATFATQVRDLAKLFVTDGVHVEVGIPGGANKDIEQRIIIVKSDDAKWDWLKDNVWSLVSNGPVLVFAGHKKACSELGKKLVEIGVPAGVIHGDKTQLERSDTLQKFLSGELKILVATDVVARGMDVKHLDMVLNYDLSKDIDSHVHRIGRTGRAGRKGIAYTLVSKQRRTKMLPHLIESLRNAEQTVPVELIQLARTFSGYDPDQPHKPSQSGDFKHKFAPKTHNLTPSKRKPE